MTDALRLAVWDCGHIEVDRGKPHNCDGRDVCSAVEVKVVPVAERDELRSEVKRLRSDYDLQTRVLRHLRAEYDQFRRAALTRDMSPEFVAADERLRAENSQLHVALERERDVTDRLRAQWDDLLSDAVVDAAGWEETMEHGRIGTVAAERVIRAAMDAARETKT